MLARHISTIWFALLFLGCTPSLSPGQTTTDQTGFVPLFNGRDLTGWRPINTLDGTFYVRDGMIITTGKPTGFMVTDKQYQDFILEMEWKHTNTREVGNSGLFLWGDALPAVGTPFTRGIEVQVLVNLQKEGYYTSQGDIFSIWGATCVPDRPHPHGWARCLPSENRCKGGGEWNHYRVVAQNGSIKLSVNGKEVSGVSKANPRRGYIALESEGAECMFRNLKIKELPAPIAPASETTPLAQGHRFLLSQGQMRGWDVDPGSPWSMSDWMLAYRGKKGAGSSEIWNTQSLGDVAFIADWRFPADADTQGKRKVYLGLRKSNKSLIQLTDGESGSGSLPLVKDDASLPRAVRDGASPLVKADAKPGEWNRLEGTIRKGKLSLTINGKEVLNELPLENLPSRGPIGLIASEGPVDFANLFVKDLE